MSFFVILTILNVYPLRRLPSSLSRLFDRTYWPIWFQVIPFAILGVMAAGMAGYAQRSALNTMVPLEEWGFMERVVQAFYGLAFYVGKSAWPVNLAALYELPQEISGLGGQYGISILFVFIATVVLIVLRRRLPALAVAGLIYLVLLAPVLGFFQSGPQFVADKYSYVSCIGWAVVTKRFIARNFVIHRRTQPG